MTLEYVKFAFTIRLKNHAHIGDGEEQPLARLRSDAASAKLLKKLALRQKEGKAFEGIVKTVARASDNMPILDVTALRGALRSFWMSQGFEDEAAFLFGPLLSAEYEARMQAASNAEDINRGREGKLWLFGGLAEGKVDSEPADLPFWNHGSQSFILTGIRLDEHLRTVRGKHLYNTEFLSAGTCFKFDGIFHGTADEFVKHLGPLLASLKSERGFSVGGLKGYGFGAATIEEDAVVSTRHFYDVWKHAYDHEDGPVLDLKAIHAKMGAKAGVSHQLCFSSRSPFLVIDPLRGGDRDPDWLALQESASKPYLSGKAVMQALRLIAGRIELERWLADPKNDFDYAKLPDVSSEPHLRKLDKAKALSSTQRLFGVAGWAKTLRIADIKLETNSADQYRGQMIKLDVLTQGPIDGALVDVLAPVPTALKFHLIWDLWRYEAADFLPPESRLADETLFNTLVDRLKKEPGTLRLGHAGAVGFGWFEREEGTAP